MTIGHCNRILAVLFAVFFSIDANIRDLRDQAHPGFAFDLGSEDYPDFRDGLLYERPPGFSIARKSSFSSTNGNSLLEESEDGSSKLGPRKRAPQPLVDSSAFKTWPELLSSGSPKLFIRSSLRTNGQRGRQNFVRDFLGGKFHFSPAKKRPAAYYSEPEGSEFLGGPGK